MRRNLVILAGAFGSTVLVIVISYFAAANDVKLDLVVGSLGTIVGALSLAFGSYFALLAVEAFGHLRVIRDAEEKASATLLEVQDRHTAYKDIQAETIDLSRSVFEVGDKIFIAFGQLISAMPKRTTRDQRDRHEKLADTIILERARFLMLNPSCTDAEVTTHMLTVADKGAAADLELLDQIATDGIRSAEVKSQAKLLAATLRTKLVS